MKGTYKRPYVLLLLTLLLAGSSNAQTDFAEALSGPYVGLDVGTISYNTQITFDGVDDPAGRGGFGYGFFAGYNHFFGRLLLGGEVYCNLVKAPDPYTFDPNVTGFSDLDIKRSASLGLDLRSGYQFNRWLVFGSLGYSTVEQTVLLDGTALDQFPGGAEPERIGRLLMGLGFEVSVTSVLSLRCSFEQIAGHDLDRSDFGSVATNAGLQRLDVEPSIQQFFIGTIYRI